MQFDTIILGAGAAGLMCAAHCGGRVLVVDHARAAGEKIRCPLLVLWGDKGKIGEWYPPLDIWGQYATAEVSGGAVNSGHYLAEEAPGEVLEKFFAFFK